jgi:hypothetical protein
MSPTTPEPWPLRSEDLATFQSYDAPTRSLVLRLVGHSGGPTETDWAMLAAHPQAQAIASRLLTLPAYEPVPYGEDDDDDIEPVPYNEGGPPYDTIVPIPRDEDEK